jgi:hypothetical protein
VFAEQVFDPHPWLLVTASGFAEGLLARREEPPSFEPGRVIGAIARVQQATVELTGERFGLSGGYGHVVWGRLDELQPTDVINPLDVSRFFFEGRSEARLPVAFLRGRVFFSRDATLEAVYVPAFRRGRFDQLDEPTSPFNIAADASRDLAVCLAIGCPKLPLAIDDREPSLSLRNAQGGARFSGTTGRLDWSVSGYRGFEPFGFVGPGQSPAAPLQNVFPRFTMIGGDFETVRGKWGVRGEVAAFVDDSFQAPAVRVIEGQSIEAGLGVDRRAGNYQISGTVVFRREWQEQPAQVADVPMPSAEERSDLSLILSADRTFSRERYRLRVFGVATPDEGSGFLRAITSAGLRDNLSLEASAGWFIGQGADLVGRFGDSDFGYLRLKYYF